MTNSPSAPVYENPKPVSVVLVPIQSHGTCVGLLGMERGIPPGVGKLALPGGFVERGETSEIAAAREALEETWLVIDPPALWRSAITPNGLIMLLFHIAAPLELTRAQALVRDFVPNEETRALRILDAQTPAEEWAFPLHFEAAQAWLAQAVPAARPPSLRSSSRS